MSLVYLYYNIVFKPKMEADWFITSTLETSRVKSAGSLILLFHYETPKTTG